MHASCGSCPSRSPTVSQEKTVKLVRALLAAAAALGIATALQVTTAPAASAQADDIECVACWNSTGP